MWAYFPRDVGDAADLPGPARRSARPQGGGRAELLPFAAGYAPPPRRDREHAGQRLPARRVSRAGPQVARRARPDAGRGVQSRLRPGRGRPGDPEPDQLRDLPPREAAVFPGGDRRLFVPARRCSTRAASAARRRRPTVGPGDQPGRRAAARDDLRRRQAGRSPRAPLDAGRVERAHRPQPVTVETAGAAGDVAAVGGAGRRRSTSCASSASSGGARPRSEPWRPRSSATATTPSPPTVDANLPRAVTTATGRAASTTPTSAVPTRAGARRRPTTW